MPMNTRRDFLSVTIKGSAIAVATALLPGTAFAAGASDMNGSNNMEQAVTNGTQRALQAALRVRV